MPKAYIPQVPEQRHERHHGKPYEKLKEQIIFEVFFEVVSRDHGGAGLGIGKRCREAEVRPVADSYRESNAVEAVLLATASTAGAL